MGKKRESEVRRYVRLVAVISVWLIGSLLVSASQGHAVAASPPAAHAVVEIGPDGLEPADVAVRLGERVQWDNNTSLPRRVVGEGVGVFRSDTLMPDTGADALWPGADTFEHAAQFAGTFSYRVETSPQATADKLEVLHGTLAVAPRYRHIRQLPDGMSTYHRWAAFVPEGWTYDVRVQHIGDGSPPDYDLLYEGLDVGSAWLPFDCGIYDVRVRLRDPDGAVSEWSPPSVGGPTCIE